MKYFLSRVTLIKFTAWLGLNVADSFQLFVEMEKSESTILDRAHFRLEKVRVQNGIFGNESLTQGKTLGRQNERNLG